MSRPQSSLPTPRSPLGMLVVLAGIVFFFLRTDLVRLPAELARSTAVEEGGGSAEVVTVHDGDTLTVRGATGEQRVRIYGIDCPEKGQPFGDAARSFLRDHAGGRSARLEAIEVDRLDRLVARVEVGGEDVAESLLRAGLAWHFRRYSDDARYQAAEDEARTAQRGLWADPDPVPPWEWRQRHPR